MSTTTTTRRADVSKAATSVGHLEITFDQMHDALLVIAQMTIDLAVGRGAIAALPAEQGFCHFVIAVGRWMDMQIRTDDPSSCEMVLAWTSKMVGTAAAERSRAFVHGAHGLRTAWDDLISHCVGIEQRIKETRPAMSAVTTCTARRRVWLEVEIFENDEFTTIGRVVETDAGTWRWTHTFDPSVCDHGGSCSGIAGTQGAAYEALIAQHDRALAFHTSQEPDADA